tara:strand:+ start:130 stop:711 length:582 start_codon:yes stop_codon:yes gene_type:complete
MFKEKNNKKWFSHPALEVKESTIPNSGIGIFTNEDILAHTVIESSPVLIFSGRTFLLLNEAIHGRHILSTYPFQWADGSQCLAWGLGSLFQHKMDCNVSWRPNDEDYNRMVFTTKVDIKKGEELFIKYASTPEELWFVDEEANMGHIGDEYVKDPAARAMMGLKESIFHENRHRLQDIETLGGAMQDLDKKDK